MLKKCSRCKEEKDISLFGIDASHDDNLHHYCRECSNKIAAEWRKNHHEKVLQSVKTYRENPINRFKIWAKSTIADHRRNGFPSTITGNELIKIAEKSNICRYCNTKLNYERGNKKRTMPNSPSLDRINNEKILTLNNVQVICHRCNTIKHDMTHIEFIKYCENIVNKFIRNGSYDY